MEGLQPKKICKTIIQGGAEMVGVRVVGFPEDGRQQHQHHREATVAVNVLTAQHETQGVTSRTTRVMTGAAEGLLISIICINHICDI